MRALLIFLFLYTSRIAIGQTVLHGKVTDENGVVITNVNLVLKNSEKIFAFASTDKNGQFSLKTEAVTTHTSGLILEVNHISYQQLQIPVLPEQNNIQITLQPKHNVLEEVRIGKPPPIRQKQDTIIFQVQQFADSIDRKIGEVLQKMPGFHVAENGKISYNGQAISNFYIDGDDLLGSRYALGTKTIPHNIVGTVEVYKNHQAIKVLKDKLNSNDITVNLSIKESAKSEVIGEIKAGGGIPEQYHININNIYLGRQLKMLNAASFTTLEQDVEAALRDLSPEVTMQNNNFLLQSGMTNIVEEPASNFKRNNSAGIFSNVLFKSESDWAYKLNGGIYWDKKRLRTHTSEKYFLSDGMVDNSENSALLYKPINFNMAFNVLKNSTSHYFSNDLEISLKDHNISDSIVATTLSLNERLKQRNFNIKNLTQYIPETSGEHIWRIALQNTYTDKPETQYHLSHTPLIALMEFGDFTNVTQKVTKRQFQSKATADLTIPKRSKFSHMYELSIDSKWSSFESALYSPDNKEAFQTNNDNQWNTINSQINTQIQWNPKKIRFTLRLPIGFFYNSMDNKPSREKSYFGKLLLTPYTDLQYILSSRQRLKIGYNREQDFGRIEDIYSGLILTDFRTLRNTVATMPYLIKNNYTSQYSLEFIEHMLFANLQYTYTTSTNNLTNKVDVEEGKMQNIFIKRNAKIISHRVQLSLSKFLAFLSGTSSLQFHYSRDHSERILNEVLLPFYVDRINVLPRVQGKIYKVVNWRYYGNISWNSSKSEQIKREHTQTFQHNFEVSYSWKNKMFWTIDGNFTKIKGQNYDVDMDFLNSSIRYVTKKPFNMEYELSLQNILDRKQYNLMMVNPNITFNKAYALRGRTAMLSVSIPFDAFKKK